MAKKTKAEEEYADLVIQSLVQEDYSVSKPVKSAATSNESQDMEDKGDVMHKKQMAQKWIKNLPPQKRMWR